MNWLEILQETVLDGLPAAIVDLCPDHVKKDWLARLNDHNPFSSISANHDLVRATRLAWIEAALKVLNEAKASAGRREWRGSSETILAFDTLVRDTLIAARAHAFDRDKPAGSSPIDAHVAAVISGVPELVSPGEHGGIGAGVTTGFTATLAALSQWPADEIPGIYQQIAAQGLPSEGGAPPRRFGELVFAAFAELIKDPTRYPEAREAFYIAMDKLGRDIGQATLDAVKGLDGRLEHMIAGLDALEVFRDGATRYLELLPRIAEDAAAARASGLTANEKLDELLRRTAQNEGVPLDALRAILRDMGNMGDMGDVGDTLDAGQISERLKAKAGEFRALTERLNRLSNDDPEVSRLRQQAATALKAANFAQADSRLAAAEARDLEGVDDLKALARQKRLSAAESRAERAAAARLRTNPAGYREAAGHFGEAARIAASADAKVALGYRQQAGRVLIDLGTEFGQNSALSEAIEHFQDLLRSISRDSDPLDWAMTQNNLGTALRTLGERESGTARLEQAVEAYRAALEERTRTRVPLDWAMTLGNQGVALGVLAERRQDLALATEALDQIDLARATFESAGHAPNAAYYSEQADRARARIARLKGGG